MHISDINSQLVKAGAKPTHINRIWRSWAQAISFPSLNDERFPLGVREILPQIYEQLEKTATVVEKVVDGQESVRMVVKMRDGEMVESVLLPRDGVCVSSQVGCAVGCVFCMTGKSGLIRHLTDLEIIGQVVLARRIRTVKKVVFMGMGEPSHNRHAVLRAIDFLAQYGAFGYKNLVLSTVGDKRLFDELLTRRVKPALAISLHTTQDKKRRELLPNAPRLTIQELIDLSDQYAKIGHYPIQYQWTLIEGVNDGNDEITEIERLFEGKFSIINMIPVNSIGDPNLKRPTLDRCRQISQILHQKKILVKMRKSAAQEIDGGCGQLRARTILEQKHE